jgi:Outer membrane protein beta-barrel domain
LTKNKNQYFVKKFLLICLLAIIAVSANAQIYFAPEIGINSSFMDIKSRGDILKTTYKEGIAVGGVAHLGLGDRFYIQSGAFYIRNGCKLPDYDAIIKINTIQVPLYFNLKVNFRHYDDEGVIGYLGVNGYLAYNFSGKTSENGKYTSLKIGSAKMDALGNGDDIKPMDYGVGINLGAIHTSGFFSRVWYQVSLTNLDPSADAKNSIRSYATGISVGYMIGYAGDRNSNRRFSKFYRYKNH